MNDEKTFAIVPASYDRSYIYLIDIVKDNSCYHHSSVSLANEWLLTDDIEYNIKMKC
jgi:hypothetical protein